MSNDFFPPRPAARPANRRGLKPRLSAWKPLRAGGESALADFHELRRGFIPLPAPAAPRESVGVETPPQCMEAPSGWQRVGFSRLSRTEAGIYPAPAPAADSQSRRPRPCE
jgi:hypothetical protein